MPIINPSLHLGFDIGSISINTVVMGPNRTIIENRYDYCHGKPFELLLQLLKELELNYSSGKFGLIGITGTGGKLAQTLVGGHYINEIVAQSSAVSKLYPEVKT
ncbi:MAG: hypothetical protein ACOCZL_03690, partial [Bacteroidota bacterium]